jgi:hypothetical protein
MDEALAIPGTRRCEVSSLTLRRLAAGELSAEEERGVRRHLSACERCERALGEMEREAAAFRRELPFAHFERSVRARGRSRQRPTWARPIAAAAAAALALGLLAGPLESALAPRGQGTRLKSGGAVDVYAGGIGAAPRTVQSGEALAPGERIRVGYHAADGRYLLVLSIDESGEVTPLYPEAGRSLKAEPGKQVRMLPDSVELTGRGWERLIALVSEKPLEVEAVRAQACAEFQRARSLQAMTPLPVDAEEFSYLLKKP